MRADDAQEVVAEVPAAVSLTAAALGFSAMNPTKWRDPLAITTFRDGTPNDGSSSNGSAFMAFASSVPVRTTTRLVKPNSASMASSSAPGDLRGWPVAGDTVLPLLSSVRTFSCPRDSIRARSRAISTFLAPPTLMPRSNATTRLGMAPTVGFTPR